MHKKWINYQKFVEQSEDIERDIIASVYDTYFVQKAQGIKESKKHIQNPDVPKSIKQRPMSCLPPKQPKNRLIGFKAKQKNVQNMKERSLSRVDSKISKYPESKLPDELSSMVSDVTKYKNLTLFGIKNQEKDINSKLDIKINEDEDIEASIVPKSCKVEGRINSVSPISKQQILRNIERVYGGSPQK